MITHVNTKRMVVVSDLHLGNPFFKGRREFVRFLRWASETGHDVCINGDGLEVAQVSFRKIAVDLPDVIQAVRAVAARGRRMFYVIGNHDIALENFLADWGPLTVAPFLNVVSGGARIHVEHGHLYDPVFVRHPRLYEWLTAFSGLFLALSPSLYRLWIAYERFKARLRKGATPTGEPPAFRAAAAEIARRGFDAVVFGHTHKSGDMDLGAGRRYLNSGAWQIDRSYVRIDEGQVTLERWKG